MREDWSDYQEEAAAVFRSLGFEASTNVTVDGVRTSHDIDVVVQSAHAGFPVTWIVECKHWKSKVSKLHVLGLRTIVADVGADRGVLLCEVGFQSGASDAAAFTNVIVTSLAEVQATTRKHVTEVRLRAISDRLGACRDRYWEIPKEVRIAHGLRQEFGSGFSGFNALQVADDLLRSASRDAFPVRTNAIHEVAIPSIAKELATVEELVDAVELLTREFEARLQAYEDATELRWTGAGYAQRDR